MWTVGDTNGNGIVDEGETFGTRVNIAEVLLEEPGNSFAMLAPVFLQPPIELMFGFIDVVDAQSGPFRPNGYANDINADGQYGYDGFDTDDPGREPDLIFFPNPAGDLDDLVRLPSPFQSLGRDAYARY
ncbi:MAG TPA: hypothetical protein VF175_17305, partial [Lacipirellula sp.]